VLKHSFRFATLARRQTPSWSLLNFEGGGSTGPERSPRRIRSNSSTAHSQNDAQRRALGWRGHGPPMARHRPIRNVEDLPQATRDLPQATRHNAMPKLLASLRAHDAKLSTTNVGAKEKAASCLFSRHRNSAARGTKPAATRCFIHQRSTTNEPILRKSGSTLTNPTSVMPCVVASTVIVRNCPCG
jgi:hypothetical protein